MSAILSRGLFTKPKEGAERRFISLVKRDIAACGLRFERANQEVAWCDALRSISSSRGASEAPAFELPSPEFLEGCSIALEVCRTRAQLAIFRKGRLSQSVPSAERVGRRIKCLIYLNWQTTRILAGGFELASPMFNLRARDEYLGWRGASRLARSGALARAADLSLYFCNPQLSRARGSKLVALCALSAEVRQEFRRRYGQELRVVTSVCASGNHSPVLNRLGVGDLAFTKVGVTGATSLSHISRETIQAARVVCGRGSDSYVDPNVRALNTVADALRKVGLSRRDYIDVAPPRAIYVVKVFGARLPASAMLNHWRRRWMPKGASCLSL